MRPHQYTLRLKLSTQSLPITRCCTLDLISEDFSLSSFSLLWKMNCVLKHWKHPPAVQLRPHSSKARLNWSTISLTLTDHWRPLLSHWWRPSTLWALSVSHTCVAAPSRLTRVICCCSCPPAALSAAALQSLKLLSKLLLTLYRRKDSSISEDLSFLLPQECTPKCYSSMHPFLKTCSPDP